MTLVQRSAAVILLFVFAASCGGSGDSNPTGTDPYGSTGTTGATGTTGSTGNTGGGQETTNQISIIDGAFLPSETTVSLSTTVTWTWNGSVPHNVTFANGSIGNSGDRSSGTFSRTFSTGGSFSYQCTIHPGMTGTINVQ